MNLEDIRETDEWILYELGQEYLRSVDAYNDTDVNYRMFNGDQWYGLKATGVEKVQYNIIKPIVDYKTSTINQNLWAINFSSDNFDKDFRQTAERVCEMLNRKSATVWERIGFDHTLRLICEDSAITSEGIAYNYYNEKEQTPEVEILNKCDVMYGNENQPDIQKQPYILIKRRVSMLEAYELAKKYGVDEDKMDAITPEDWDVLDENGEMAKYEVRNDDKVTLLVKMYKDKTVHVNMSTRYVELLKESDTGLTLYPVAHMLWRQKKGSARGEGEVKYLIPNQLELNKTLMRRLITIKNTAFPQKVVNMSKLRNPEAINNTGGIIKYDGMEVEDVRKMFTVTQPATMSSDVGQTINDLITITRNLSNAGDIATGSINPEQASGKAILAVQQASSQPLVIQSSALKQFVEDIAKIWVDMWTAYGESLTLQEEVTDGLGKKVIVEQEIPQRILTKLKASVKIDCTPMGAFDRFAQEQSLENLFVQGFFNPQRYSELRVYANALPDNSVMPKQKLLDICDEIEAEQQRIAQLDAQSQMMMQRASQYINADPQTQDMMMQDAMTL